MKPLLSTLTPRGERLQPRLSLVKKSNKSSLPAYCSVYCLYSDVISL